MTCAHDLCPVQQRSLSPWYHGESVQWEPDEWYLLKSWQIESVGFGSSQGFAIPQKLYAPCKKEKKSPCFILFKLAVGNLTFLRACIPGDEQFSFSLACSGYRQLAWCHDRLFRHEPVSFCFTLFLAGCSNFNSLNDIKPFINTHCSLQNLSVIVYKVTFVAPGYWKLFPVINLEKDAQNMKLSRLRLLCRHRFNISESCGKHERWWYSWEFLVLSILQITPLVYEQ